MKPWKNLDEAMTPDGKLVLRQRGEREQAAGWMFASLGAGQLRGQPGRRSHLDRRSWVLRRFRAGVATCERAGCDG